MSTQTHHTHEYHRHHSSSHRMSLGMKIKRKLFSGGKSGINSAQRISRISRSTSQARHDKYMLISRRVLFCIIFIGIIAYLSYSSITADIEDTSLKSASLTASETTQLKMQVSQLKNQVEILESELARYKQLYGELNELPASGQTAE